MLPSIFGENLLDEFFDEPWEKSLFGARNPLYGKHAKNLMKTDVKETCPASRRMKSVWSCKTAI